LTFTGGNAKALGYYGFPAFTPFTTQAGLALPWDWNLMTGIAQWQVMPNTIFIMGNAAPQFLYGSQFIGGSMQYCFPFLEYLLLPW